jgi:hypothetical protein
MKTLIRFYVRNSFFAYIRKLLILTSVILVVLFFFAIRFENIDMIEPIVDYGVWLLGGSLLVYGAMHKYATYKDKKILASQSAKLKIF